VSPTRPLSHVRVCSVLRRFAPWSKDRLILCTLNGPQNIQARANPTARPIAPSKTSKTHVRRLFITAVLPGVIK
jgi:hypothetical protein